VTSYRMLPRARLGLLLIGPVLALIGFFMVRAPALVIGLGVGAGLYLWSNSWGCTLEDDAIVIEAVSKRRIPWSQIQAISYNISRLATAATIVDEKGKVWMLRAPSHSTFAPDPLLRAKMTEIESFWKEHRGRSWQEMSSISGGLPVWQRTA
jgi:hypothetical protein